MRPSLLPSLLARCGAQCMARGFERSATLFEIGAAFQSGMPGAQTTNAAGLITGAGTRDWSKSGHAADLFDAKGAMLAALEAAMGSGHDGARHGHRAGLVSSRPQRRHRAGAQSHRPFWRAASQDPGGVRHQGARLSAFEIILDAVPEPKSKGKVRNSRLRRSRRLNAISPLWWTVRRGCGRCNPRRQECRTGADRQL